MSVMPALAARSFHVDGRYPSPATRRRTSLRRLRLLVAAAAVPLTATVLFVQPARADNSTELIQDELRVAHAPDGTPQTIVISRVVTPEGDVLSTTAETL